MRKVTHSFEVHSNESASRKSGRLGLEQVILIKFNMKLRFLLKLLSWIANCSFWSTELQRCMYWRGGSSDKLLLCLGQYFSCSSRSSWCIVFSIRLEPGGIFEHNTRGTDIVGVDIDVNLYYSLEKVLLCFIRYFSCFFWSSWWIVGFMILEPGE